MGIKTDRAIIVDEYLATSALEVYAVGDCAQTLDGFTGLWTVCRLQGLVAGANLMAKDPGSWQVYKA